MFGAQKHAINIDRILTAKILKAHFRHHGTDGNTSIINQNIQPTFMGPNIVIYLLPGAFADHIMGQGTRLPAISYNFFGRL